MQGHTNSLTIPLTVEEQARLYSLQRNIRRLARELNVLPSTVFTLFAFFPIVYLGALRPGAPFHYFFTKLDSGLRRLVITAGVLVYKLIRYISDNTERQYREFQNDLAQMQDLCPLKFSNTQLYVTDLDRQILTNPALQGVKNRFINIAYSLSAYIKPEEFKGWKIINNRLVIDPKTARFSDLYRLIQKLYKIFDKSKSSLMSLEDLERNTYGGDTIAVSFAYMLTAATGLTLCKNFVTDPLLERLIPPVRHGLPPIPVVNGNFRRPNDEPIKYLEGYQEIIARKRNKYFLIVRIGAIITLIGVFIAWMAGGDFSFFVSTIEIFLSSAAVTSLWRDIKEWRGRRQFAKCLEDTEKRLNALTPNPWQLDEKIGEKLEEKQFSIEVAPYKNLPGYEAARILKDMVIENGIVVLAARSNRVTVAADSVYSSKKITALSGDFVRRLERRSATKELIHQFHKIFDDYVRDVDPVQSKDGLSAVLLSVMLSDKPQRLLEDKLLVEQFSIKFDEANGILTLQGQAAFTTDQFQRLQQEFQSVSQPTTPAPAPPIVGEQKGASQVQAADDLLTPAKPLKRYQRASVEPVTAGIPRTLVAAFIYSWGPGMVFDSTVSPEESEIFVITSPFIKPLTQFGLFALRPEDFPVGDAKGDDLYTRVRNKTREGRKVPPTGAQGLVSTNEYVRDYTGRWHRARIKTKFLRELGDFRCYAEATTKDNKGTGPVLHRFISMSSESHKYKQS